MPEVKSTVEVLKAARKLIEKEENWTRDYLARHANGNPIGPHERNAACWCSLGAMERASGEMWGPWADALESQIGGWCIDEFNDNHTHPEVIAAFDKAISNEQAKEKSNA